MAFLRSGDVPRLHALHRAGSRTLAGECGEERRAEEGRGAPEPPGSHASRVQLRPTVVPSSSIPQRRASGTRLVPSSGTVTWGVCRVALHLDDILILT